MSNHLRRMNVSLSHGNRKSFVDPVSISSIYEHPITYSLRQAHLCINKLSIFLLNLFQLFCKSESVFYHLSAV